MHPSSQLYMKTMIILHYTVQSCIVKQFFIVGEVWYKHAYFIFFYVSVLQRQYLKLFFRCKYILVKVFHVFQKVLRILHKNCIILSNPGWTFEMQLLLRQLAGDRRKIQWNTCGVAADVCFTSGRAKEKECKFPFFLRDSRIFPWFSLHRHKNPSSLGPPARTKPMKMQVCASKTDRQSDAFSFRCSQMGTCSCKDAADLKETNYFSTIPLL